MIASDGFSIVGSGRCSTRMSPGAWRTAPSMVGGAPQLVPVHVAWTGTGGAVAGVRSGAAKDLLGDGHRGEGLRPAGVEREVGDRLGELVLGSAVVLRVLQVEGELLGVAAGEQGGDCDQAAV